MRQKEMNLYKGHGGRRPGSGRKRIRSKGVAHRTREKITKRNPLHINFKLRLQIRNKMALSLLKRAIVNARVMGLRIVHYSLQSNHVHLIVEAENNEVLTRGMRSLTITFCKGHKAGRVQIERYHLHVLKHLREVKNAVQYVLFNEQKHRQLKQAYVDRYSSLTTVKALGKLAKMRRTTIVIKERVCIAMDGPKTFLLNQAFLRSS